MKINNVLVGSDIEYFLRNKETKEIVSAEGIIKGTKYEPFLFKEGDPFYATSLDNVLAEGNIPPAKNEKDFLSYLNYLRFYIDSSLPEELETVALASAVMDPKYMTPHAKIFGCDPSWNCWNNQVIFPQPKDEDTTRAAGFHIHVGYDQPDETTNLALAKWMDIYLGIPSVLIEPTNDRKKVGYGCAGNFRNQRHGLEYRSLSSFFSSDEKLIRWVYSNTHKAIDAVNKIGEPQVDADLVQLTINEDNHSQAEEFVKQFSIALPF